MAFKSYYDNNKDRLKHSFKENYSANEKRRKAARKQYYYLNKSKVLLSAIKVRLSCFF